MWRWVWLVLLLTACTVNIAPQVDAGPFFCTECQTICKALDASCKPCGQWCVDAGAD